MFVFSYTGKIWPSKNNNQDNNYDTNKGYTYGHMKKLMKP